MKIKVKDVDACVCACTKCKMMILVEWLKVPEDWSLCWNCGGPDLRLDPKADISILES